jgi:hypothetical protein
VSLKSRSKQRSTKNASRKDQGKAFPTPRHHVRRAEAPDRGEPIHEAPESRVASRAEAPDAGEARFEHESDY